jgi:hypothetical protein
VDQLVEASRHFTKSLVLREAAIPQTQIQRRWRKQLASVAPRHLISPALGPAAGLQRVRQAYAAALTDCVK